MSEQSTAALPRSTDVPRLSGVTPQVEGAVSKLDVIDYLAGDWDGTGWSTGPEGRSEYVQHETIRRRLSGEIMTIEGTATMPDDPSRIVFNAFALVSWNAEHERYDWLATSFGHQSTTELVVTADGWEWTMPAGPTGQVTYVTTFDADRRTWHETGAYTPDGEHWSPIMEMTLTKTADAGRLTV